MRTLTTIGLMVVCILVGVMLAAAGEPPPAPVITAPKATAPPPPTTTTTTTTVALAPSLGAAIQELTVDDDVAAALAELWASQPDFPIDEWKDGYRDSGAPTDLLPIFVQEIIPCESGYPDRPDAETVVSRTRDVGFAQINRAVHKDRVEAIWPEVSFTESMQMAYRNGYFTGVLALDSGLQPWYMSRGCHGR